MLNAGFDACEIPACAVTSPLCIIWQDAWSGNIMPFQDIIFHKLLLLPSEFQGLFPRCFSVESKRFVLGKRNCNWHRRNCELSVLVTLVQNHAQVGGYQVSFTSSFEF